MSFDLFSLSCRRVLHMNDTCRSYGEAYKSASAYSGFCTQGHYTHSLLNHLLILGFRLQIRKAPLNVYFNAITSSVYQNDNHLRG